MDARRLRPLMAAAIAFGLLAVADGLADVVDEVVDDVGLPVVSSAADKGAVWAAWGRGAAAVPDPRKLGDFSVLCAGRRRLVAPPRPGIDLRPPLQAQHAMCHWSVSIKCTGCGTQSTEQHYNAYYGQVTFLGMRHPQTWRTRPCGQTNWPCEDNCYHEWGKWGGCKPNLPVVRIPGSPRIRCQGTKYRTRSKTKGSCSGTQQQSAACTLSPCRGPDDCWSTWGAWGACGADTDEHNARTRSGTACQPTSPSRFCRTLFQIENAPHFTASARILIPARCSAVS